MARQARVDEFRSHIDGREWEHQLMELMSCYASWPELFSADEAIVVSLPYGGDAEGTRKLQDLSHQLSRMALWHEQKAEMLHHAAIRLSNALEDSDVTPTMRLSVPAQLLS